MTVSCRWLQVPYPSIRSCIGAHICKRFASEPVLWNKILMAASSWGRNTIIRTMSHLLLICALLCCWNPTIIQGRKPNQQPLIDDFATTSLHRLRLNFSSTAPHVFSSVHGFLRQGYNTYFNHGFSIVPCEIPSFTPLYHGWLNDEPPKSPEWLASTP